MLIQLQNVTLSFGEKTILSHIDMEIKGKEKIGVVGANGTGKSTLLKLLSGELQPDHDDKRQGKGIFSSRKLILASMAQDPSKWMENCVEDILLEGFYLSEGREEITHMETQESLDYSQERFFYEQKYDRMLQRFGFQVKDKEKKLKDFSGGEQTKLMLVKCLLTRADLLLLDEPTNHLDGDSVEALEEYVAEYPGAVVIVSHDRFFLDRFAEVIYELEDAKLTRYSGNYTEYRKEKRKRYEKQLKAYERQQDEIRRNEELIRQFKNKPKKAAFARSRKSILNRMEKIEKPKDQMGHLFTGEFQPEYPGPKYMVQMEKLQVGYPQGDSLLGEIDLRIRRGQKIGVIGKNGAGKSTLVRTLVGLMPPLKGKFQFGEKVLTGYFDQSSGQMDSDEKVIEHFHKLFPGMTEKELYGRLAAFLFRGAACQQKISSLSGGEKARLKLCELLTLCPNFLILDEPTNHMDIPAKETLESAFGAYTGTMLIVSHDRYFLDQVADAILVLEDQSVYYYPFGYSHYLRSRKRMTDLLEKGVSLDELPGMLSSQEQAMVEALKAVPKAERHESRRLTDEEAYIDWKLSLAEEPLEKAEQEAAVRYLELQERKTGYEEQLLKEMLQESDDLKEKEENYWKAQQKYETAMAEWTKRCLEWYEIWKETIGDLEEEM